jgi:hypothetical protein
MDETAKIAPGQGDRGTRARALEERADLMLVDPRVRVRIQVEAAQGHQRSHRCIHIDGHRSVQCEVKLFFVFVLPEDTGAGATGRRKQGKEKQRPRSHATGNAEGHEAQ